MNKKLYVVVDRGLPTGLKIAQSIHASYLFAVEHMDIAKDWYINSNNLVVLESDRIADLAMWLRDANFKVSYFREPDMHDVITAICVEPKAKRVLSGLPLAQ